jgi:hypothetical protein
MNAREGARVLGLVAYSWSRKEISNTGEYSKMVSPMFISCFKLNYFCFVKNTLLFVSNGLLCVWTAIYENLTRYVTAIHWL